MAAGLPLYRRLCVHGHWKMQQDKMSKSLGNVVRPLDMHRIGRLEIGESSVMIAVSSPHRAEAFDACRFAIDTLKETVPVWKKEFFEDGEVWVGLQGDGDHRH